MCLFVFFLWKKCTTAPSEVCLDASVNKHLLLIVSKCLWDWSVTLNEPTIELCLLTSTGTHKPSSEPTHSWEGGMAQGNFSRYTLEHSGRVCSSLRIVNLAYIQEESGLASEVRSGDWMTSDILYKGGRPWCRRHDCQPLRTGPMGKPFVNTWGWRVAYPIVRNWNKCYER